MNKHKTVCCMHTSVTSRDDLDDVFEDLREVVEDELKHGPLHVTVEMSAATQDRCAVQK